MIQKTAAPSFDLTQQAVEKLIADSLAALSGKLRQETKTLTDKFDQEVKNIITDLNTKIEMELRELGSVKTPISMDELQRAEDGEVYAAQLDGLAGVYKAGEKKLEHPTPRDSEHNDDLPDFWRRNFDYLESPYMNLDKIDKITDRPPFKGKGNKSE